MTSGEAGRPGNRKVQPARISRRVFHTAAVSGRGDAQMKMQRCFCFSTDQVWISRRNVWGLPVAKGSVHFSSPTYASTGSPPGRLADLSAACLTVRVKAPTSSPCFLAPNTALAWPR